MGLIDKIGIRGPNLIFLNLIGWDQEQNCNNIKVRGSIKGQIEKIHNQISFCKMS